MSKEETDRLLNTDVSCTGCGRLMDLSNSSPREGGGYYCPRCCQTWGHNKSPEMRKFIEEISVNLFGVLAGGRVCPTCKSKHTRPEDFRDLLSRREFTISGICQACQDKVFGSGEPEEPNIWSSEEPGDGLL